MVGDISGWKAEIEKIAEEPLRYRPGRNIVICTFVSVASMNELREYFRGYGKNFLLFELDSETSAFNIKDKNAEWDLFGHIDESYNDDLREKSKHLLESIQQQMAFSADTKHRAAQERINKLMAQAKEKANDYESRVEAMSKDELQDTLDEILSKGKDNITEEDKRILNLISKKI
jgi:hypothetical protein